MKKKTFCVIVAVLVSFLVLSCQPEPAKTEIAVPSWAWGSWEKSGAVFVISKQSIAMNGSDLLMPYNYANGRKDVTITQSYPTDGYDIEMRQGATTTAVTLRLVEGRLNITSIVNGTPTAFDGYTKQ